LARLVTAKSKTGAILITGAVQSNFVRTAAAAAARYGLTCHIQLEERVKSADALYRNSGNVLLNQLLGATIHSYPDGEDESGADLRVHEIADVLRTQGRRPYVIPLAPGHPPLGALGYVVAAQEIISQLTAMDRAVSEIVVASGSGLTHAGLLFGLRMLGSSIRVLGICVRRDSGAQALRIRARCREISELLEVQSRVTDADINLRDEFLAPGYGQLNSPTRRLISASVTRDCTSSSSEISRHRARILSACAPESRRTQIPSTRIDDPSIRSPNSKPACVSPLPDATTISLTARSIAVSCEIISCAATT
jgi:D-cysteine desulfhydrase/L-cysteate sulfo-lyase